MEFENLGIQEIVFICYYHEDTVVKHTKPEYDRDAFVKIINTAYVKAVKEADFATDVHDGGKNDIDFAA